MTFLSSDTVLGGGGSVFQNVHLDGGIDAVGPFAAAAEGELAEPEGLGSGHVVLNFSLVFGQRGSWWWWWRWPYQAEAYAQCIVICTSL